MRGLVALVCCMPLVFTLEISWPENEEELTMHQNESELFVENLNITYLSRALLGWLNAVEVLELENGHVDKVYVKPELTQLSMSNTNTKEVEIDPDQNYNMLYLSIKYCLLKALPSHLHRLSNVRSLNFDGNEIDSVNIDGINSLKNLEFLYLSDNRIKMFFATIAISLPNLNFIFLSDNELITFEVCDWKLPNLLEIDLMNNELSHTVLNPWEFRHLGRIRLRGNPLDCVWLSQFRAKNAKLIISVDANCREYNTNSSFPVDCSEAEWSQCGKQQSIFSETIVNGQDASRDSWPWHAAVYHKIENRMEYACGGTLISRIFVLTAAHCIVTVGKRKSIMTSHLQVRLGMHILDQMDPETQELAIQQTYKYDNFSRLVDDISLLELSREALYSRFVQPICIDYSGDLIAQYGTVVGWGLRSDDKRASVLQSTRLPVHGVLECLLSSRRFFGNTLNYGVICAGYSNGTAVCNGDSGGGMYFQRNNTWYIGGIVAFSEFRAGASGLCKTDSYAAFTNVSHHAAWIKRYVRF